MTDFRQNPRRVRQVTPHIPAYATAGGGVPAGGTTGQVLKKNSNADGDAGWGGVLWSLITSTPTTLAGYGITDAVKNAGGTPSIQAGTHAARPAFGTAGRWYYETDTNALFYDTGAAWVQFPSVPVSARTTAVLTTASLVDGVAELGSLTLTNTTNALVQLQVDRGAWVRFYSTQADRDADVSRLLGTTATPGKGVLAEFYLTAAGTIDVSPVAILANDENAPQYRIWYNVVNKSGATHTVVVTLTLVPMDAPVATTQAWSAITGTPTTLAGYGITDATPLTLTTKGDLLTFSTVNARLPVGADGYILSALSSASTGLAWSSAVQVSTFGVGINGPAPVGTYAAMIIGGSITAVSGSAYGIRFNQSVNASANNDSIYGALIDAAFTVGAFTGVTSASLRIVGPANGANKYGIYISGGVSIRFDGLTSGAGAGSGTLTNAPAAGNPAFWLKVNIAGTDRFIPCW